MLGCSRYGCAASGARVHMGLLKGSERRAPQFGRALQAGRARRPLPSAPLQSYDWKTSTVCRHSQMWTRIESEASVLSSEYSIDEKPSSGRSATTASTWWIL